MLEGFANRLVDVEVSARKHGRALAKHDEALKLANERSALLHVQFGKSGEKAEHLNKKGL